MLRQLTRSLADLKVYCSAIVDESSKNNTVGDDDEEDDDDFIPKGRSDRVTATLTAQVGVKADKPPNSQPPPTAAPLGGEEAGKKEGAPKKPAATKQGKK